MQPFTLSPEILEELQEQLSEKSVYKFRHAIEGYLNQVSKECEQQLAQQIEAKQSENKAALYNELRTELATKEFVRAEINEVRAEISEVRAEITEVRAEIKEVKLLMRVVIGVMIFGFTLFNPSFIQIVQMLVK